LPLTWESGVPHDEVRAASWKIPADT
jgi:hypothetical protein